MQFSAPVGLALALALGSAASAQIASPQATTINIKNFDFSTMTVTVAVNGAVTWKNLDAEPHTVVAVDGQFRSPALDQGDSFTFRFAKAGTYRYVCSIHPQMQARIVVK